MPVFIGEAFAPRNTRNRVVPACGSQKRAGVVAAKPRHREASSLCETFQLYKEELRRLAERALAERHVIEAAAVGRPCDVVAKNHLSIGAPLLHPRNIA